MPEYSTNRYNKITAYFLGFISFVLFVYILMALSEILIPVTIAIFLTYLFHPLLMYFRKIKIPKWLSVIIILIIVGGLYYLLGFILIASLSNFPEKLEAYSHNLSGFLYTILKPFNITVHEFADFLNLQIQEFEIDSLFKSLFEAGVIQNIFNSFSGILGDIFIALIFWIFMILGKEKFERRLKLAFKDKRETVDKNLDSIDHQLQSYIIIKTILSFITGAIATLILMLYGIDFAIVWGLLTFFLNYIPNIGSLIATIAPILVSLLEYGFGFTTISLSALLLINQNIIGNLIEPHYLGRQMDLSPVFVLFSLIFWGSVWGIVGMFLAVPIAAAMKILFSNIEPLKPLAIIMGSKVVSDEDLKRPEKRVEKSDES
ncbi:MAG: AI-2E family transporter [Ignavibacteriales bacterium]|nr:MAG: AI-2E family transporter [Ignavibacteriales bacterium]